MLLARVISRRVVTLCFRVEFAALECKVGVLSIVNVASRSSSLRSSEIVDSAHTVEPQFWLLILVQKNGFILGPVTFALFPILIADPLLGGGGGIPGGCGGN